MDITIILILFLNFIFCLLFNFLVGPIFGRFLRRKFKKQTTQKTKEKRSPISTTRIPDHKNVLIEDFKHKTPKSCDFCSGTAVKMVAYDHGDSFGGEVFCCDDCIETAIAASKNPINLPFLGKDLEEIIEESGKIKLEEE